MPQLLPRVQDGSRRIDESISRESNLPVQTTFVLPASPDTKVYMHLKDYSHATVLLLSVSNPMVAAATPSLGSFAYSLPNSHSPSSQPLSTSLYAKPYSIDFMTRLGRVIAKKLQKPVYVGGDVKFWSTEDESAALRTVIELVMRTMKEKGPV